MLKPFVFLLVIVFACSKDKKIDRAGPKMQDFIRDISTYAREIDEDFIIIPQNGIELAHIDVNPENELDTYFLSFIDGFGMEELFFNGNAVDDDGRLTTARKVVSSKKILVSDYTNTSANQVEAKSKNAQEGFLSFPRTENNYDYMYIPNDIENENNNAITKLSDAQNYLYLISTANYSTKSSFLSAIAATNFDVVIIDLFYDDIALTKEEIGQLKMKANGGKRLVVSYMSIGSAEKYRYYWKWYWSRQHPVWIKRRYEGYKDEYWVNFWHKDWRNIIFGNDNSYTKKIMDAGFDGVYLDNVEAYYFLYRKD
jgi:cysteinyl-tRNA synthetase